MKKVLFVATVVKTHIMTFHIPYLEWFKQNGYETHVCAKNDYVNKEDCVIPYCDKFYDIPFARSPVSPSNLEAYRQLKGIIDSNEYDIIHCHTPVGGVLARLAARHARKNGTKVIYTAHGFHFYKGAPIKDWLMFYPVEKFFARYTDVLITINREDYAVARKFKAKKVVYVPGVGVDVDKFARSAVDRSEKRKQLGIPEDTFVLLSVGELIKRKNHETVIRTMERFKSKNVVYLICGQGELDSYLQGRIDELGVNVRMLGFRKDIGELLAASDLFIFPSYQEGLPVALMEAMAAGKPVVCTSIRGNTDLIEEGAGGFLVEPEDIEGFAKAINRLAGSSGLMEKMGSRNREFVREFDMENVMNIMGEVYKTV